MATINDQLLEKLQTAYKCEQAYLASLSASERSRVGQPNAWSPKDTLAHIAEWKAIMARRINLYRQDQDGPFFPDLDAKNAEIFQELSARTEAEVAALLAAAHAAVVTETRALSTDQLLAPGRFAWQRGQPLIIRIPFNAFLHSLFHMAQLYVERGDRPTGDQLIETMTTGMYEFDDAPQGRARWTYTRACYFAIAGDRAAALADLRQAFEARPDLIAWSKEDTDLQSLWKDAEYQSLVA